MRNRFAYLATTVAALSLACGGGGDTGKGTGPITPVVTTVIVNPNFANLEQGSTQTFTADVRDQQGAIMSGQTVTWSTGSAQIASVDGAGKVTALAAGTTSVLATSGSKAGTATVVVTPLAVASVTIGGSTGSVVAGTTANLSALLKDKNGNTLTGRPVTWKSSNTIVASIDANGIVSALSAGTTTITATSETISSTLSLVVTVPAGAVLATISSITPATLTPGATATITGANFGSSTALNAVYISGVKANVTAATATQLTATVPLNVPCQATQAVNVDVVTVAGTVTAKQQLQVATSRVLTVGQTFLTTATGNIACNELPTSGTYIVSVFNAARTFSTTVGLELKGVTSAGGGSLSSLAPNSRYLIPATRSSVISAIPSAEASAEQEHLARLEQSIEDLRQYRKSRVARSISGSNLGSLTRANVPVPTTVGATATINYNYTGCGASATKPKITSRVVYVGPKVIVLEDNAGPLAGKIDADLIAMAQDFENVSYPILINNFGNPLAWDASTDNNGRIIMMFSPQVNNTASNLLGFVQPCDLLSPTDGTSFAGTNQAEIFYARAVTDTTPGSTALNSRAGWKRQMPATLIHETKHIISFAERFQTPVLITDYEDVWLEEATAQLAGELYGRAIHGNTWRGDAPYVGTLDCEVRPSVASCNGATFVMGNHFGFLSDFLQNYESKSIVRASGDGSNDDDIYGSSWLFTRWLTDVYGGSNEGAFIKSMVLNYNIIGPSNAESVSGKTWAELVAQFSIMLAADDLPGVPAAFQEASWNLPAVWLGYNADFSTRPATPFVPRPATFGSSFVMPAAALHGGAAMVVKLTPGGGAGTQLLDLHDPSGNPLPSSTSIGISVLRIQ